MSRPVPVQRRNSFLRATNAINLSARLSRNPELVDAIAHMCVISCHPYLHRTLRCRISLLSACSLLRGSCVGSRRRVLQFQELDHQDAHELSFDLWIKTLPRATLQSSTMSDLKRWFGLMDTDNGGTITWDECARRSLVVDALNRARGRARDLQREIYSA